MLLETSDILIVRWAREVLVAVHAQGSLLHLPLLKTLKTLAVFLLPATLFATTDDDLSLSFEQSSKKRKKKRKKSSETKRARDLSVRKILL